MSVDEFKSQLKIASKVFVWVEFSENHFGFLNITKAAISEFIDALSIEDNESVYATVINNELYIGAPTLDD